MSKATKNEKEQQSKAFKGLAKQNIQRKQLDYSGIHILPSS